MPKTDIDYSNTIIYKITCNDPNITDVYVGHTTNFVQRKHSHKQGCVNTKSSNYKCKLYETIRNNSGWSNWKMEIINFFNCADHYEARKKEQEYFVLLNANLNSIEPFPKPKIKPNSILDKQEAQHIYCQSCNVYLQNMQLLGIHNDTKKHLNKINSSINITEISSKKYECKCCSIICNKLSNWEQHLLTRKHKVNDARVKSQVTFECDSDVESSSNEITPMSQLCHKFCCEKCDYGTSKKSSYDDHLVSNKHIKSMAINHILQKPGYGYSCDNCDKKYKDNSGLWRHKKKCVVENCNEPTTNIESNQDISQQDIMLEYLINENKVLKTFIMELIKKDSINNTFIE